MSSARMSRRRTPEEVEREMWAVDALKRDGYSERAACKRAGVSYSSYRFWNDRRKEAGGTLKLAGGRVVPPADGGSKRRGSSQMLEIQPTLDMPNPSASGGASRILMLIGPNDKLDILVSLAKELGVTVFSGKEE